MRNVAVLGATGSIGTSALDVISRHPARFRASVLAAHRNAEALAALCERFKPDLAVIADSALEADLPGLEGLLQNTLQISLCQRAVAELQQRHELLVAHHERLLSAIARFRSELEEAHHRLASLRALPFVIRLLKRRLIAQTEQLILEETPEQARRYAALRMLEQDLRQSRRLNQDAQERDAGDGPPAQEDSRAHACPGQRPQELRQVEQPELHPRVLSVVPRHDLALRLRQVERAPPHLCGCCQQEYHERRRLQAHGPRE